MAAKTGMNIAGQVMIPHRETDMTAVEEVRLFFTLTVHLHETH